MLRALFPTATQIGYRFRLDHAVLLQQSFRRAHWSPFTDGFILVNYLVRLRERAGR